MQQCSFDRNIVQFYGFCPSPPMLVLEFMEARPPPAAPRGPAAPGAALRFSAAPGGLRSRRPSRSLRGQQPACAGCRELRALPAGR
jgi:hypothetical protein